MTKPFGKIGLSRARYTWRDDQVLRCLAAAIGTKITATNGLPSKTLRTVPRTQFVREGEQGQSGASPILDIGQWPIVPPHIVTTTLRPDLVLCSNTLCVDSFVALTVPWEDAVDETNKKKGLQYADMASEAGWHACRATVRSVEVGCNRFIATSTIRLLKDLGISG